jgi:hypothetical protein
MNGLFPIIRRARRSLLPPDDAALVVPLSVVESPPFAPLVESVASAPAEVPAAPVPEPTRKKSKRGANAPA